MTDVVLKIFNQLSDVVGIQWAPVDIPMTRRLQTLATTFWVSFVLFGEGLCIYFFIKLLYSDYWWIAFLYSVWMMNNIDVCNKGGRRIEWFRNWTVWRYFCEYFPIRLIKTAELDPNKNYLFACYPHGVLSTGALGAFATNALDFYKKFPGMICHFITLRGHFLVPFFREFALAFGMCSCTQESLEHLLDNKKYKGNCVAMMIGGAAEALDSHPGQYKITLSRRKGFIRVALKTGASLVPVFCFGETDTFHPPENPEDSLLRRFQLRILKITGISLMFPAGRGMFQYSFGLLPMRKPITNVVGAPLEVKKILDPTSEEIDAVHAEFTERLINLFESEKSKYLENHESVRLVIQ